MNVKIFWDLHIPYKYYLNEEKLKPIPKNICEGFEGHFLKFKILQSPYFKFKIIQGFEDLLETLYKMKILGNMEFMGYNAQNCGECIYGRRGWKWSQFKSSPGTWWTPIFGINSICLDMKKISNGVTSMETWNCIYAGIVLEHKIVNNKLNNITLNCDWYH